MPVPKMPITAKKFQKNSNIKEAPKDNQHPTGGLTTAQITKASIDRLYQPKSR